MKISLSIFAHTDDAMSKWVRNVRFGVKRYRSHSATLQAKSGVIRKPT